jgi:hypothetical protein
MIDSTRISPDTCVEMICAAARGKAELSRPLSI